MLIFVEGGKPENTDKNPGSRVRTSSKPKPHMMTAGLGIEPGSHCALTTVISPAPPVGVGGDSTQFLQHI